MYTRLLVLLGILLMLGGCGSSGDLNNEELRDLEKRETILIIHNYPQELCTVKNVMGIFKDLPATKNGVLVIKDNGINCANYSRDETHKSELKDNLDNSCSIVNALEEEKCYELNAVDQSCVLGVDWSLFGF